jgi:polysaccharide pyruvyl transferase WcaK-like protein
VTAGRRVFLAGAFGQGNPGDEALLAAFRRALPGHVPVAASSDPAATAAAHGVAAVRRDEVVRVARAIARADAVVIAGGTVFKALHPASGRPPLALLRRTAALAGVTRALRKPLALVGVGAGALRRPSARVLARAIVRAADLLILRDDESAAALAAIGAATPMRVGADAAWTLLPDPPARGGPRPGPVVVALSHLAGGRGLGEWLAAGLRPLVDAGVPVRLDPWQPPGDASLAAAVAARLGERAELAPPPADLGAARAAMTGARQVVALRFHALVAAASAGTPALAVAHEAKLAGLARRLGQPAVDPGASPAALSAAVRAALDSMPPAPAAIRRERTLAEDGFRLMRVLLARGRSDEAAQVDGLALRPEEWLG